MRKNPVKEDIARIKRELAALNGMKIRIGIQGDEGSEVLMIAKVHEFGATIRVTPKMRAFLHHIGLHLKADTERINIPERSFIRKSYEASRQAINRFAGEKISDVISGKLTATQAVERIGAYCVQITQGFIDEGKVSPKVSDFTQAHKTQHTTLYQTGTHIRDRITFIVE